VFKKKTAYPAFKTEQIKVLMTVMLTVLLPRGRIALCRVKFEHQKQAKNEKFTLPLLSERLLGSLSFLIKAFLNEQRQGATQHN